MGETDKSVRDTAIKIVVVAITIMVFFWMTGCASQPPQTITIEKPVVINGPPEFLRPPSAMFSGCVPPGPLGPTNGDLLVHDHGTASYATCLRSALDAIQKL